MAFSRTAYFKAWYFASKGAGLAVVAVLAWHYHRPTPPLIAAVLLLFVPGRILAYFWKDLLWGLQLLNEKRYEESIRHSQAFLDTLQRRPWVRHLIWLGSSSYSRNPWALAYNNLGAAEFALGQFEMARTHLHESIRHDNLNPLPYHNLSLLAQKEGNAEEALLMRSSAVQRGLTFGLGDKIVMSAQKSFARSDGKGTHSPT